MLTLDRIVKEAALRIGDRNFERLHDIRSYVQDAVTEITMLLRKGSVLLTTTLSVTDNIATLPDGVCAVLKIWNTGSVFFEVVDNTEFRSREVRESSLPTAQVFEDVPNWRIKMLNYSDTSLTLNVDYLIASTNPAILPDYYRQLILAGTLANYHADHSDPSIVAVQFQKYNNLKNQFKENQQYNDSRIGRMKGEMEIEISDPNNSFFLTDPNSTFNLRGTY